MLRPKKGWGKHVVGVGVPVDGRDRPIVSSLIQDQQEINRLVLTAKQEVRAPKVRCNVDGPNQVVAKNRAGDMGQLSKAV
jgi:hypothetical protein